VKKQKPWHNTPINEALKKRFGDLKNIYKLTEKIKKKLVKV